MVNDWANGEGVNHWDNGEVGVNHWANGGVGV